MSGTDIALSVPVILILTIVGVSIAGFAVKPLINALILSPVRVKQGQIHRLVTAGWIHSDVGHLFFNMFSLYMFANQVSRALGTPRFLLLYLTAVVVAFVPTTLRHMNNPQYFSLGASGGVTAVMFSAILLHPGLRLALLFLPIPVPGFVYALGYLAYSAYSAYRAKDGVNHSAHFAGAIYGSALTFVFEPQRVMNTLAHFF